MDERAAGLLALLPEMGEPWPDMPGQLRKIRLRTGAPVQLIGERGEWLSRTVTDAAWIGRAADALAAHSLYARDEELRQGYLPLADGSRAGVCGRFTAEDGQAARMTAIRSVCVRVAHARPGCADGCMPFLYGAGRPLSVLILSAPGMGKTTLLRDVVRQFSRGTVCGRGVCAAVADERRELAGGGALDVGPRTDVMEGCPKAAAIGMLVRAMAPDVIATDELGGAAEAAAVMEAARCGVALAATAHARGIGQARERGALRRLLNEGVFERIIVLDGGVGRVDGIYDRTGKKLYDGRTDDGHGNEAARGDDADSGVRGAGLVDGAEADAAHQGVGRAAARREPPGGGYAGEAAAAAGGAFTGRASVV